LVIALKDAFAYCDGAYDAMTDASGAEMVNFGKVMRTPVCHLELEPVAHLEHYGNVVGYLRMKSLVPPTSERKQNK
jgi:hypothetical protein